MTTIYKAKILENKVIVQVFKHPVKKDMFAILNKDLSFGGLLKLEEIDILGEVCFEEDLQYGVYDFREKK